MEQVKKREPFRFKQFSVAHDQCAMPVGTDGTLLGAWIPIANASAALDIGTGSGLIALMLAQRSKALQIDAVEIDPMAATQASENVVNSPFDGRIQVHQVSIQDFAQTSHKQYDLIVCNPPFFSGGALSSDKRRNQVRHTLKLSHGDLLDSCRTLLSKNGKLSLPLIEGLRFQEMSSRYGFFCNHITEVQDRPGSKVVRLLLSFQRSACEMEKDHLILKTADGKSRSDAHQQLVSAFYL